MTEANITDIINSCRDVEYTLWLEHSDEYNYINAYNLAYLSQLSYSRVVLDNKNTSLTSMFDYDFSQFVKMARKPYKLCYMNGEWNPIKMRTVKDEGKDSSTDNLIPFIEFVDIGKGITYPDAGTGYVDESTTSTSALFYIDENRAVISVRGTAQRKDGFIDADAEQIKPEFNIKGELHKGFYTQVKAIIESDSFRDFLGKITKKELFITGHSLGGAVATILSAYLFEKGFKPLLYTYGSPRVGNVNFAKYYSDKFVHFRHVNCSDIVPTVPGRFLDGSIYTIMDEYIKSMEYSIKNDIDSEPSIIASIITGLKNFEGDCYTHHGTLCQYINYGNDVLMLPFSYHEIHPLKITQFTVKQLNEYPDDVSDINSDGFFSPRSYRNHSIKNYLNKSRTLLKKIYGFYKDNCYLSEKPQNCVKHALYHLIQQQIKQVKTEKEKLKSSNTYYSSVMMSDNIMSLSYHQMKKYDLWVEYRDLENLYNSIIRKLENLNENKIGQGEIYGVIIKDDIEAQLEKL